ncbi:unnamed protein product [Dracunculus medinensis]|uniref:G protein-coupled receptor n=1 Tax=Dracunculus medinensis TaxID=318479 RepID=A0A0N4UAB7_DRAME|nr:unnamed protein product [Dracunculus medinensis]
MYSIIIYVLPSYLPDALINICFASLAIPINIYILYLICKNHGQIKGSSKLLLIEMVACYLYAAIGITSLDLFYLISLCFKIPHTIFSCSLLRRIFGMTLYAPNLGIFVVAVDRYATVIWRRHISRKIMVAAFVFPIIALSGDENCMSDKKLHSDVHAGAGRFLVIFEECIAKDVPRLPYHLGTSTKDA